MCKNYMTYLAQRSSPCQGATQEVCALPFFCGTNFVFVFLFANFIWLVRPEHKILDLLR